MVRRNTRRLNRRRQRKQRGGTGAMTSAFYKTLAPVDAMNAPGRSIVNGYNGCSAPMFDVFNGNNLDQAFLSASGVAPSQGGGRKRRTRKVRKVRKSRRTKRKTKRKHRGGAVSMIVPLAVGAGGYYLWNKYNQPMFIPIEDTSFSPIQTKRDIRGPPTSLSKLKDTYKKLMRKDTDGRRGVSEDDASIRRGHY